MSELMAAYLDALTRELSFDPRLARRLRTEAEDHLREAIASDPMGATIETERRAISRFGAARDIAAQCALPSLVQQVKNAGAAATLIAIGRTDCHEKPRRMVWRDLANCQPPIRLLDQLRTAISSIDRYAFWCALLIAICSWTYVSIGRASGSLVLRRRLRQSLLICAAAAFAVVITVLSDATLTALKLFPTGRAAASFFPCLTIGLETALAVVLVIAITHHHAALRVFREAIRGLKFVSQARNP